MFITVAIAAIVGLAGFGLGWFMSSSTDSDQSARREAALAVLEEQNAILDDPAAFGSEHDIAAALAEHAVPDALMDDAVFGAVPYETGFYNTLYGGNFDAEIDTYYETVSDDGSQSIRLWNWHGTNAAGNPFELPGISVASHDDDGRITYELVTYPYPDDYVRETALGDGN